MDTGTTFIQTEKTVHDLVREWAIQTGRFLYAEFSVIPTYSCKPGEVFYHDEAGHRHIVCSIYNDWDWDYRWDDIIAEERAKAQDHLRRLINKTRYELDLQIGRYPPY